MEENLFSRFAQTTKNHPDNIACQMKEGADYKVYTYQELYSLSLKIASFIQSQKIPPGERLAIILENGPWWPAIYFGILGAGCSAVPVDPKLTPQEVINIIRDSQAKLLFTSEEIYLPLKNLLQNILFLKKPLLYPFPEISAADTNVGIIKENSPEDLASLLYTSGTTALPKAVMLTNENFCANFESIKKTGLIKPNDNVIALLPLHHSYPFMVTLITPLLMGAKITYLNSLKTEDLFKTIRETQATILIGVPQLFYFLHKSILEKMPPGILPLLKITNILRQAFRLNLNKTILQKLHRNFGPSLRLFICGGARLDPQVTQDLYLLGFTILEGYGLTETSPVVTFNPLHKAKAGSVGLPLVGVKIRIDKADKDDIGEVLIQGKNVMKGYYRKPQETAKVIQDNWFYSGDLGYLDKKGYLYLTGRSKEVVVLSSGKNIYPEEIERHYLKSPYLKEICVLESSGGINQTLRAVIVPNIDYFRKTKEINIQEKVRWILENLSRELPPYKRIMGITIAQEELPKTRLGKLKRYEIKQKFISPPISKKTEITQEPLSQIARQILGYLRKELKKEISLNNHLELDLGVDSLSRIEIGMGLEKLFKINISDASLSEVFTVRELITKIESLLTGAPGPAQSSTNQPDWRQIIQENPQKEILNKINLTPGLQNKLLTAIICGIMYLFFKIFSRLKIQGIRNLKNQKLPFLICPNHASFFDGFIVAGAAKFTTQINLFFLGYSGYFKHPLVGWALKGARLIAIDPTINLTDAMQASGLVLRNNKALCIFPEGERSIDGRIKTFKKGVGILIKETGATVIPCYIQGSFEAWPRGKDIPLPRPIKIIFGKPVTREELKKIGLKYNPQDDYEAITLGLREKVLELRNP